MLLSQVARPLNKESRSRRRLSVARRRLSRSHRARGLTTEIAAHGDALRVHWPRELTAVSSAAFVRKRADQLIAGRDKRLQGRVCPRARRLNA